MGQDAEPLVRLAQQRFPHLTETERRFFAAVAEGRPFDLAEEEQSKNNPALGSMWPAARAVSVDCIAWLCTNRAARDLVGSHGIRIAGARIEDGSAALDLQSVDVPFGLLLTRCYLPHGLVVSNSSFRNLKLSHSRLAGSLDADGLVVERSVEAVGTTIDGDVNLRRLRSGDNVDFSDARVEGTVHLAAASIAQDLRFTGAFLDASELAHSDGDPIALNLDLARVGGTLYLDGADEPAQPFHARGVVRLVLAQVGGNVDCWRGQFEQCRSGPPTAEAGDALYANGAQIGGSVFFAHGMTAHGKVSLRTSRIQHYLNIYDVKDGEGPAFPDAALDLQACHIGTLNCDTFDWTLPGQLALNGFEYDRIEFVEQIGDVELQRPLSDADFLTWLSLQEKGTIFPQTYEQLASVLRREGYQDQAREILIQKERELAARSGRGFRQFMWWNVYGPMTGFGHNPLRGFRWLLGVWLVGAVVFSVASRRGWMIPPSALDVPFVGSNSVSAATPTKLQPLMYSLDVLMPIVDLGQASRWVPDRRRPGGAAVQWFHWCLIIVGWTLTTLVVAGISGVLHT